MNTVVIAEKPSQAKDLKAALGSAYGEIIAAQGHLIRLAEPEEVKPDWKQWSFDVLWPGEFFPLKADEGDGKGPRLRAIKQALARASRVIIATDCDREGQLIGEELLDYLKFKGKVERAMFTAQDPVTLKKAFQNLRPNQDYRGLGNSARARQQADQVFNLTITRCATIAFRAAGSKGVLGVGRVKTAALAIVCIRELEILDFKPETYFVIEATVAGRGGKTGRGAEARTVRLNHSPREEDRIGDPRLADAIVKAALAYKGPISVETEPDKHTRPPRLPDLPDLQKTMGSKRWTAKKVLEIAQSLYEKHFITYPRAEAKYLAEAQIGDVDEILAKLKGLGFLDNQLPAQPVIRKGKNGHFSDEALKGLSHHAVVPNVNCDGGFAAAWATMSRDEQTLFEVISRRFVAAVSPDFVFDQTTMSIVVRAEGGERVFSAIGKVVREQGWKAVLGRGEAEGKGNDDDEEGGELASFRDGESVEVLEAEKDQRQTKPPPRYNEGTLIDAMQNAWRFVPEGPLQERLKECKGIGTPATRDSIIDGLKKQGQIQEEKGRVVPTKDGLAFYRLLRDKLRPLVDPGLTAQMEMKLDSVVDEKNDPLDVVLDIVDLAKKYAAIIKKEQGAIAFGSARPNPPTPAMSNAARTIARSKGIRLPPGVEKDFGACKAFLDQHPRAEGERRGETSAPSQKQIEFARSIADSKGIQLPEAVLASSKALAQWIDANMEKRRGGGGGGNGKTFRKGRR